MYGHSTCTPVSHLRSAREERPEWTAFRLALNPDWEPQHSNEFVTVAMLPAYFELWRQVIRDCQMDSPQEFIRFYDGAYEEHPHLDGVYVRQGQGVQRWMDGRVYEGEWVRHVYEGRGKLYDTPQEYKENQEPSYEGQWQLGRRHGDGIFRWEQDVHERGGGTRRQHVVGMAKAAAESHSILTWLQTIHNT